MTFLTAGAFALALLLPLIVVMYLLKLRRIERPVSSTYLWRQMVRDVEANAPWQRLRWNLLLFLQLLFLAILILSLARPATPGQELSGPAAIFIIDASASMSATDAVPTRLQAAKEQARQLIESLPQETKLTLIAAGVRARVMASNTGDRLQVFQALQAIQPGAGGSDMATALQIAAATAARQPGSQIVVLSDGKVTLPERPLQAGQVRYYPIGTQSANQAVGLLNLQVDPGGKSLTAFAQAVNYGDQAVKRRLGLYADGLLLNAFDLELPAGDEKAIVASGILTNTRLVEARLLPADGVNDYLPTDDSALAVPPPARPLQVNLVSRGNRFLETALSLWPGAQVSVIDPDDASDLPDASLTIFDAVMPVTQTTDLPGGSLLFIAPPRNTDYFTVQGKIGDTQSSKPLVLLPTDPADPLLRNVSLDGVNILDGVKLMPDEWALISFRAKDDINSTDSAPMLFSGEAGGRRMAVLAFDLRHSDLPLQLAFPVLFANLLNWLAPGVGGGLPEMVSPGQTILLTRPPDFSASGVPQVKVTRPDGSDLILEAPNGQVIFDGVEQLGLYTVDWGVRAPQSFVVNLFAPQESAIQPAGNLALVSAGNPQTAGPSEPGYREWWRPAALLALLLLVIEWLVYQRAALARLSAHLRAARPAKIHKAP